MSFQSPSKHWTTATNTHFFKIAPQSVFNVSKTELAKTRATGENPQTWVQLPKLQSMPSCIHLKYVFTQYEISHKETYL